MFMVGLLVGMNKALLIDEFKDPIIIVETEQNSHELKGQS